MKIVRRGVFNINLLAEEIEVAFPELFALGRALFTLDYIGQDVIVTTESDIDAKKLDGVFDAHDPNALSRNQVKASDAPAQKDSLDAKLKGLGLTADELKFLLEYSVEEAVK